MFSPKCGTLPALGITRPGIGDPDEMCPLAAEPGESILPRSPALQARGSPWVLAPSQARDLWGAEAAPALGKNWEVAKKKTPQNLNLQINKKNVGGDYFLQSPVVVEDGTDWNNFSERAKPRVGPRCCWILLLSTGVPINQALESTAFCFFPFSHGGEGREERKNGSGNDSPPTR